MWLSMVASLIMNAVFGMFEADIAVINTLMFLLIVYMGGCLCSFLLAFRLRGLVVGSLSFVSMSCSWERIW